MKGEKGIIFSQNFYLHNVGDYPPISDILTYVRGDTGGGRGCIPPCQREGGSHIVIHMLYPLPMNLSTHLGGVVNISYFVGHIHVHNHMWITFTYPQVINI
jgi:hypothetical protein